MQRVFCVYKQSLMYENVFFSCSLIDTSHNTYELLKALYNISDKSLKLFSTDLMLSENEE